MDDLLRKWEKKDAQTLARIADNPLIAKNLRDQFPAPYQLKDAEAFIDQCLSSDESGQYFRAIQVEGEVVGSISLSVGTDVYRKTAELGYFLAQPYWGRGIMTRAVRQICTEGFGRYDLTRIFATSFAWNIGSRKVLEKAGFELEGVLKKSAFKNGQVVDTCVYAWFGGEKFGAR